MGESLLIFRKFSILFISVGILGFHFFFDLVMRSNNSYFNFSRFSVVTFILNWMDGWMHIACRLKLIVGFILIIISVVLNFEMLILNCSSTPFR